MFPVTGFRNFKAYYQHVNQFYANEFGHLVSYNRLIELMPRICVPLCFFYAMSHQYSNGLLLYRCYDYQGVS